MAPPSGKAASGGASGRLEALVARTLASLGLELVHLVYRKEGRRWVLRLLIDREGGVTLDDCADASNQLGAVIEVEDAIPHSYVLEVSSPGVDRPLFKESDYLRFKGRAAQVRTQRPLNGRRHFQGDIVDCREGVVSLALTGGEVVELPLAEIVSGRLEVDLDQELGRPARDRRPAAGGGSPHNRGRE